MKIWRGLNPGQILKKKYLLWGISFLALLCAGSGAILFHTVWTTPVAFPSYEKVRADYTRSDAVLLDRRHAVIHELRMDSRGRRLDWIPITEISPAVQSAIVRAEDRRFYGHHGPDWISLARALAGTVGGGNPHGASTITMQLVSKLNPALQPRGAERSVLQKLLQIHAAQEMEKAWTKPEILEAYLNLVTYRGELQGIASAAEGLFSKKPHGLDRVEALILAALIRSPNAGPDAVVSRARMLAERIENPMPDSDILQKARQVLSRPYYVRPKAAWAPHVALELLKPGDDSSVPQKNSVVSTLDERMQRFAIETLSRHLQEVRSRNVNDGAVLVVANRTGEVLAYVGNSGDRSSARHVDGIRARRQAGSTLKPFIYGMAFERRLITAASLIDDSPLDIAVAGGMYRPRNYDNRFHGPVTARNALASSLNVPAVKVLNFVGNDYCIDRFRNWGFGRLRSADYYGPSLALGSADISLWELVNAYRAMANGGARSPLRLDFPGSSGSGRQVLSPDAAFLVADILSDRESRSLTFSLESPLATRYWSAVKTGTSKDMRDNWCVGFSDRYTVGVWVGNFSGESMWNVSGITGAAPVWLEVMNCLHENSPGERPAPPPGVVYQTVALPDSGKIRKEWFVRGTEMTEVRKAEGPATVRIASPVSGTVIALDPDIPEDRQKVLLEASSEGSPLCWVLDGEELGSAASVMLWSPVRGEHTLALVGENGRVLDTVSFEVRGTL